MNKKKAKALRRVARDFVIKTNKPISEVQPSYKKFKISYKAAKGEI